MRFNELPFQETLPDDCPIKGEWMTGPCAITPYSSPRLRANFDTLLDRLAEVDPSGSTWDTAQWDHFGVEWVEWVFIRPDSKAWLAAEAARYELCKKPHCLNEWLAFEYAAQDEADRAAAKEAK